MVSIRYLWGRSPDKGSVNGFFDAIGKKFKEPNEGEITNFMSSFMNRNTRFYIKKNSGLY